MTVNEFEWRWICGERWNKKCPFLNHRQPGPDLKSEVNNLNQHGTHNIVDGVFNVLCKCTSFDLSNESKVTVHWVTAFEGVRVVCYNQTKEGTSQATCS